MAIHLPDLRESNAFLTLLLEQMPAVVLLADADLCIVELNDASATLFGQPREQALGQRCGNALGCTFAVTEAAQCGETSHCHRCQLRQAAQAALAHGVPADRVPMTHTFWIHGAPHRRHLEFSTRVIHYQGRPLVALILYDVTALTEANRQLARQKAELDASLRAAGAIQRALLPKDLPHPDRLAVAWHWEPCQDLGGDALNIVALDAHRAGFYLLDVAGHGAASAMIATLAYQALHPATGILLDHATQPPRIRPPDEVLDLLNREFPLARFERHLTAVYGVVDLEAGTLALSNAAHCRPVLFPAGGGHRVLETSGTIIGLEGIPFGQETVPFLPGDRLLVVSDGLLEAMDGSRRMLGDVRWPGLLEELEAAPARQMVEVLRTALAAFTQGAPLADDVSLLALERLAAN